MKEICRKYEGLNMKKYAGNMKDYERNMEEI